MGSWVCDMQQRYVLLVDSTVLGQGVVLQDSSCRLDFSDDQNWRSGY